MSRGANRFDYVILDFDGTVANSQPVVEQVLAAVCPRYRLPVPDRSQYARMREMDTRSQLRLLGLSWWQVPGFMRRVRREMTRLADRVTLCDGMDATLHQLHAHGVRLHLLTSNGEPAVRRILSGPQCGLFEQLDCSVSLMGKHRVIRRAVARAGVDKAQVLSVGDEARDGVASGQAGVAFAGVTWGYASQTQLQAHTALPLLESPDQLLALVVGNCRVDANKSAAGVDLSCRTPG